MEPASAPNHDTIRDAMVACAREYVRLTGNPISAVGKNAVNDPAFISQVEKGRNFTIEMYRRVMSWLDDNWPPESRHRRPH
jgi:hypothetical protein